MILDDIRLLKIGVSNYALKEGEIICSSFSKNVAFFIGDLMLILCNKDEFKEIVTKSSLYKGGQLVVDDDSIFNIEYIEYETKEEDLLFWEKDEMK